MSGSNVSGQSDAGRLGQSRRFLFSARTTKPNRSASDRTRPGVPVARSLSTTPKGPDGLPSGGSATWVKQVGTLGAAIAHQGLESGWRAVIEPSTPAKAVTVELVQYARPAVIEAIDTNGLLTWQDTMTAGNGLPQRFQIAPTKTPDLMREIVISAPSDETLLLEVCLP
jgi:hypothetical protein